MRFTIVAALALTATSSLHAQTAAPAPATATAPAPPVDFSIAPPLPGNWTYAVTADGTEASFLDASARPQLFVRCTRASRIVTIAKPATAAAPFLNVWTSSQTRNLPASYNPATYRLSANVTAADPLLDAIAFSRGRFAVSVANTTLLIVPAWEEPARVVEDCRA
jgi:hypothetical protein